MGKREEQAYRDARKAAVDALKKSGRAIKVSDSTVAIQSACETVFGPKQSWETTPDYFRRVVKMERDTERMAGVVQPHTVDLMRQPEWKPKPHLRATEIDALPSVVAMCSNAQAPFIEWK